jgi:hypothetical protein
VSRLWLPLLAVLTLVALVAGGSVLWTQLRETRSSGLAVRYGAASSRSEATLADRCVGVMRNDYDRSDSPLKASVPPRTFALLAPRICALGVRRGLISSDGNMSTGSGRELTLAVIQRMGVARFQTLEFNELAVTKYHLAKPGHVTRWDRCVAMSYGGWEAAHAEAQTLPSREVFFKAARDACRAGIAEGVIPPSGVPATGSAGAAALQRLLTAALRRSR